MKDTPQKTEDTATTPAPLQVTLETPSSPAISAIQKIPSTVPSPIPDEKMSPKKNF